jgi:hypothetical protein
MLNPEANACDRKSDQDDQQHDGKQSHVQAPGVFVTPLSHWLGLVLATPNRL